VARLGTVDDVGGNFLGGLDEGVVFDEAELVGR